MILSNSITWWCARAFFSTLLLTCFTLTLFEFLTNKYCRKPRIKIGYVIDRFDKNRKCYSYYFCSLETLECLKILERALHHKSSISPVRYSNWSILELWTFYIDHKNCQHTTIRVTKFWWQNAHIGWFQIKFLRNTKNQNSLPKVDGPQVTIFLKADGPKWRIFTSSNSIILSKWVGFGLIWALSILEIGLEMSYRINPMMTVLNILKFKNFKFLVCLNKFGCIYIDINILIIDISKSINLTNPK